MSQRNFPARSAALRQKTGMGRFFLLQGLILLFASVLPAQEQNLGSPIIHNYETEQFKAHNQNWAAVQDGRGVMYFANKKGILEFDGQHWQIISTQEKATIRTLTRGADGTIYYGSIGDFGYLVVSSSGKVSAVSLQGSIPPADRTFNDIWQVLSSRDGIYFLAREKIFRFANGVVHSIQGKIASSQACVLNGTIFYADQDKGLCLLEGDQAVAVPPLAGVYNGKRIALAPMGRQELLVARITGDFLRLDLQSIWDEKSDRFDISRPPAADIVQPFPCELDGFLPENYGSLYKLVPAGRNALAVGTSKKGIVLINRAGKIIRVINKNRGLLDDTVTDIFMDRDHDLWACSSSGISHIELSVPQSYFAARNHIDGLSLCAQSYGGRLYVGTIRNLLINVPYHFNPQDDQQQFMPVKNTPNEVWQFLDTGEELLAACDGLFRIHGEYAIKVPGAAPTPYCLGTSKRWPNHLFIGLVGGMEVFQRTAGQWQFVGRMAGIKNTIRGIAQDSHGDLWAGTETSGLLQLHFAGATPTQAVIQAYGPRQGLPSLTGLLPITRGASVYVLTQQGLFRTELPAEATPAGQLRFTPDTNLGKLFIDHPVAIDYLVFDNQGDAFMQTEEGIIWGRLGKDGQYRMETRPFRGVQYQSGMIYLHPDGSLWWPGRTLFRFDPRVPKNYDAPFETLVRKVVTRTQRVLFEGTYGRPGHPSQFHGAQSTQNPPALSFHENDLVFEYSAPFFEKPGTTQFQYLLEGFDNKWSQWTSVTNKEYTNLAEGNYRFRVRARNVYGTIGREAIYGLRILPPWYRTIWAYLLWIVGGSAALAGIIYLYTWKLRRQKDRLEYIVAKRTQQLREASEQLREASLTDSLTGLRNRRFIKEILQNDLDAFIGLKNHLLHAQNQRVTAEEETVFGVFMLDIDFFKKVNDLHGHDAGDRVLTQFAAILKSSIRLDDVVVRVGGEEFLVVLKKTLPGYLPVFVAKVLEMVAAASFAIGGGATIQKTCSIGFASFPVYQKQPSLLTFEQSTMIADLGLLYAKDHGRNQGIGLKAGLRTPCGEEMIQKTVNSLDFALSEGYLTMAETIKPK